LSISLTAKELKQKNELQASQSMRGVYRSRGGKWSFKKHLIHESQNFLDEFHWSCFF